MKAKFTKLANTLAKPFRAQVVSALEYRTLHYQRLALLQHSAAAHRKTLSKTGTTGIVFSFNRPVQLHATLASYFRHTKSPAPLIIQYRATLPGAVAIYKELKTLYKKMPVKWVEESTCRATLLQILGSLKTPKMFFLVDDDIFIRPYDMKQFSSINPLEFVPTLRLHPKLSRSYTMKVAVPAPKLNPSTAVKGMLQWTWGDARIEWDYPYSVEGHLFDTAEIYMMTLASPFKAPNTYEGVLHGFAEVARHRPGLCYPEAKLFNNPCNKVQVENNNHAGESINLSPEFFLAKWKDGYEIDVSALDNFQTISPHQEIPFTFKKRK